MASTLLETGRPHNRCNSRNTQLSAHFNLYRAMLTYCSDSTNLIPIGGRDRPVPGRALTRFPLAHVHELTPIFPYVPPHHDGQALNNLDPTLERLPLHLHTRRRLSSSHTAPPPTAAVLLAANDCSWLQNSADTNRDSRQTKRARAISPRRQMHHPGRRAAERELHTLSRGVSGALFLWYSVAGFCSASLRSRAVSKLQSNPRPKGLRPMPRVFRL